MASSPFKMLTPFFPSSDNSHPLALPKIFYDEVAEFELVNLYEMDFVVEDEEIWLSGPIEERRSRIPSFMTKSTSLGSLNPAGGYAFLDEIAGDDEAFAPPRHSTPVSKRVQQARHGTGDGVHMNGDAISPIAHDHLRTTSSPPSGENMAEDLNRTLVVHRKANRTFETDKKLPSNGTSSPDENVPKKPLDRQPLTNGMVNGSSKAATNGGISRLPTVVKQGSIPPPGTRTGGLRPPSRPPITVRSTMNRTSSLGNLTLNQKMTLANSNIPVATPTTGAVGNLPRTTAVIQNGVPPKIGTSSRLTRPVGATPKLPTTGIPSGIPVPTRIPIPKLVKKG